MYVFIQFLLIFKKVLIKRLHNDPIRSKKYLLCHVVPFVGIVYYYEKQMSHFVVLIFFRVLFQVHISRTSNLRDCTFQIMLFTS